VEERERMIELGSAVWKIAWSLPPAFELFALTSKIVEAPMREAFHIGQLVRISSPSSGYADHRTYCIVCLVSTADGYAVYRVKNTVGVERLVRADEIEPAALTAVP
jgi:hypothetical protein